MRTVLFLLAMIISSSTMIAQDYKVALSEAKKKDNLLSIMHNIGIDGGHYYYYQAFKGKANITKRDMNHKEVGKQKFSLSYDKGEATFIKVIETSSGKYLCFSIINKKTKEMRLLVSEFKDGVAGELKAVHSHPFEIEKSSVMLIGVTNYSNADQANTIVTSTEQNYIGFANILSTKDKGNKEELALAVFDDKMNMVWSKIQAFGYDDKELVITQTTVDNKGNLYMLGRITKYSEAISKRDQVEKLGEQYKVFIATKDDLNLCFAPVVQN